MSSDQLLCELLLQNPEEGLQIAIEKYGGLCKTVVTRILGSNCQQDVKDLLGTVFCKLWQNAEKLDSGRGSVKAWLCRVARNEAVSFLRKQGNSTLPLEDTLQDNATGPENQCIAQMEQQEIQQAIDALEEPDRSILVRRYYYCQKGPQIALETGLTEKAVEHRLAKGRRKLHAALLKKGVTP